MEYDWAVFLRTLILIGGVFFLVAVILYFVIIKKKYFTAATLILLTLVATPPVASYVFWLELRPEFIEKLYIRLIGVIFFMLFVYSLDRLRKGWKSDTEDQE